MKMTTNDVIVRHNFITKVLFKDGDAQLSRDLKVKIMSMRIEYGKVQKAYAADVQEFTSNITTDRFNELQQKSNRTKEETEELQKLITQFNDEIGEYSRKRAMDEVEVKDFSFNADEYAEILEVNADNDITINNVNISAPDFLESIYDLFVKED